MGKVTRVGERTFSLLGVGLAFQVVVVSNGYDPE